MAFMQAQSGTYANFLFSSFPLIRRRAILDKSFAAFLRRSLPYRRIRPPGGRARWGVVQLVGHLTVNEDGEGSNPSAPANFPLESLGTVVKKHERRTSEQHKVFGQGCEERDGYFLHKHQYLSLLQAEVTLQIFCKSLLNIHLHNPP